MMYKLYKKLKKSQEHRITLEPSKLYTTTRVTVCRSNAEDSNSDNVLLPQGTTVLVVGVKERFSRSGKMLDVLLLTDRVLLMPFMYRSNRDVGAINSTFKKLS